MPITQLPLPVPSRADPANFAARGDAFLGALPTFVTEANTQATEVNNNASTASAAAGAAVVARDAVVGNAMAAAEAAGAQPWVSGTNYTTGRAVYSLVNYRIYRRVAPGGTTSTDPSADAVNWVQASPLTTSVDGLNIGIGTSNPLYKLHVLSDSAATSGFYRNSNVNSAGASGITIDIGALAGTTPTAAGQFAAILTDASNGILYFTTRTSGALTEKMRIDALGHQINLPGSNVPPTLTVNGQMNITPTSNTNARISFRGSDGVTRVANIALA